MPSHYLDIILISKPTNYTLTGLIADNNGNPLPWAMIQIGNEWEFSDQNGTYEFNDIASGDYQISIHKPGYIAQTFPLELGDDSNIELNQSLDEDNNHTEDGFIYTVHNHTNGTGELLRISPQTLQIESVLSEETLQLNALDTHPQAQIIFLAANQSDQINSQLFIILPQNNTLIPVNAIRNQQETQFYQINNLNPAIELVAKIWIVNLTDVPPIF